MADRIELFTLTVPAGTPVAAPVNLDTPFADGNVVQVNITVPDGPSGFMGFCIVHKGSPLIPIQRGRFVVANDRVVEWPLAGMPTGTGWQIQAYNTDIYPHNLYVEYLIDELAAPAPNPITIIPIG